MDLMLSYCAWNLSCFQCNIMLNFIQDDLMKDIHDFHISNAFKSLRKTIFEYMLNSVQNLGLSTSFKLFMNLMMCYCAWNFACF